MADLTSSAIGPKLTAAASPALVLVPHQPAYLPWPGYLARLLDVDQLLLLDHAQFSGQWQQRNYIEGPNGRRRLTVPVRRDFGQSIIQARISGDQWRRRHWRSLEESYLRAEFWPDWGPRLAAIYDRRWEHLADLNRAVLDLLLEGFGIQVTILHSSALDPADRKTQMLIDLCHKTGRKTLRLGAGAHAYLDIARVNRAGIAVQIATYTHPPYRRGRQPFITGLSALDLLLHQGPSARHVLAQGAETATWTEIEAAVGAGAA
ncbi:WbqC family protein [Sphaerisporangium sp. NPDC051017]|uniref:WbqC family protein n=1 Tax=Sphaerisporangium sp. NPDC051017 TaxID=3154636 RepID=UPI00341DC64C